MVNFSRQQSLWIGIILIAILMFGGGRLFSLFSSGIPIVATTATCTGTIQGQPLSQADCLGVGPTAYGSATGGWGYTTSGEGTITLPEASKQVTISGEFRNLNTALNPVFMIYNYATGNYESSGFIFYGQNNVDLQLQSRVFGSNYIDSTDKKIIKLKWNLACASGTQCVAAAEKLKVTQYDTIATITTTSTSTTSTSTIGNASGIQGQITTSTSTTSTETTVSGGAGVPVTTIVSAGQQGQITGGFSNITLLFIVISLAGVAIYFLRKRRGG